MPAFPHDITSLMLAPAALDIDARLSQLADLSFAELTERVALESDTPDWTAALREDGLLATVRYLVDCQGWDLAWDPRGLRISHDGFHIVLGIPATFTAFLAGRPEPEHRHDLARQT